MMKKFETLIEDPQFLSSTRYVVSLVVRGLQNLILTVILLFTFNNIIQFVFMLALIWYSERLMMFYTEYYKRTMGKCRYFSLLKNEDITLKELKTQRTQILTQILQ